MPGLDSSSFRSRALRAWARVVRLAPKGRTSLFRLGWRLAGSPARFVGEFDGLPFVVDPADRTGSMHLFLWGHHEPEVTAVLLALIGPEACVVDIGANRGYFSLLAAHRTAGRVISYEPLPRNFEFLRETRDLACLDHWSPHCLAISDCDQALRFDPRGGDEGRSDWGAVSQTGALTVEARTLDGELARLGIETVDVLKMDVEGHEAEAIDGMAGALEAKRITHLIVELHTRVVAYDRLVGLADRMRAYGYGGHRIREDEAETRDETSGLSLDDLLEPLESSHLERNRLHVLWSAEASGAPSG